jgi:RNA polymerase sigma factor (sigma-70 family)
VTAFTSSPAAASAELVDALRLCAAGDSRGLRTLYDREAPRMLGVALRLLRRRDLAEEVVHDCFLRVWQRASSFDPARGDPRSWLYSVLRHRALDVLRGEGRTDLVDDFEPMGLEDQGESPEQAVERLSDTGALRRCLERLAPVRRQAILLAYVNGLTHGEIAGRLGLPLGTVKTWIRRGVMALKECMA